MAFLPPPGRGLRLLRAFQAPAPGKPLEDAWARSRDGSAFALCDGASESFDAAAWARAAARGFCREGGAREGFHQRLAREYEGGLDRSALLWHQEVAARRGSHTTLLGLRLSPGRTQAWITAVGDSLAVLLDGWIVMDTFPYRSADQFLADPRLLSTTNGPGSPQPEVLTRAWSLRGLSRPCILLVTDALGAWLLSALPADRGAARAFLSLPTEDLFRAWVAAEQLSGRLRKDDCTLLVLR